MKKDKFDTEKAIIGMNKNLEIIKKCGELIDKLDEMDLGEED